MQRVSFNKDMDLLMLREVLASQAYLLRNGLGWRKATTNLLKLPAFPSALTTRTVRDRTNLLVQHYKRDKAENETSESSGVEVEEKMTERTLLLEELLNLKEGRIEFSLSMEEGKTKEDKEKEEIDYKAAEEELFKQALERLKATHTGIQNDPSGSGRNSPTRPSPSASRSSSPPLDGSLLHSFIRGKKRKAEERIFLFLEEKEKQRRKEEEERLALRRMELELQRERQEEELRLRREAEEFGRQERTRFLQMMQMLMSKIYDEKQ